MSDETREPENQRMAERLEELEVIMESTITVSYLGNGICMLEARDNEFWNSVFSTLRRHDWQVQKHLDGTMYVEKAPDERDLERRAEAEKERELRER